MINVDKVNVHKRYNGDIDMWIMCGTRREKTTIDKKDWILISEFIQDLKFISRGLASDEYTREVDTRLNSHCDNIQTIEKLKAGVLESEEPPKKGVLSKLLSIFRKS